MPDQAKADSFDRKLARYAETIVHVGLALKPKQQLIITAPIDSMPLVRAVTRAAYEAGSIYVTHIIDDEHCALIRYRHGTKKSFDAAPGWLFEAIGGALRAGAAYLMIFGSDPALLAGEDEQDVARGARSLHEARLHVATPMQALLTNWSCAACATPGWARAVFPEMSASDALTRLWEVVLAAVRADDDDPIAAWKAHNSRLHSRVKLLNAKNYAALHFRGPGTNLRVGLADGHRWCGGSERMKNGVVCNPNLPTEEVFTMPHAMKVEGFVRATRPLSYQNSMIENIAVRFEAGRIVQASATRGEEILHALLASDKGASRLGEVALVPHSSPIAQSGILFLNTLFDENAASHIAIGSPYPHCLKGFEKLNAGELIARGFNNSRIHLDWMIGSGEIDVDGIAASGLPEPLMRAGEWVD
ncbi:MAG: aminopeptidase [Salinarimonas sp.]